MDYAVVLHPAEEGGYWAEVPALPGCFSQGETVEETLSDIKGTIESHLLAFKAEGRQIPMEEGFSESVVMEKKTLNRVLSGLADRNIRFQDLGNLLSDFGFSVRIKGDHHIYHREGIKEIINLQPLKDGKAKAYQVKQVRMIIFKYRLHKGV